MSYLLIAILSIFAVFFAPSQALFPRLLFSSRTAPAVPFVSLLIIGIISFLLNEIGWFNRESVLFISLLFGATALTRTVFLIRAPNSILDWPKTHLLLGLFAFALSSFWAVRLGTTGFDSHDEIYSWNMWAIQHWLGQDVDLYYTGAPYPQLLPIVLAYTYHIFGHFEFQMPIKLSLAILPLATWFAIMIAPRSTSAGTAIWSVSLAIVLFAVVGRQFSTGLADPMVASALTLSVYSFILYRREPTNLTFLWLSLACGTVAVLAKQPGLIWALFSFPLLVVWQVYRKTFPFLALVAPAILIGVALAWIIGPGSTFTDNPGVIARSQQGMAWHQVLWYGFDKWALGKPLILFLFSAAIFSTIRTRENRDVLAFFLVPAVLAWWIFGSYHLRLGAHTLTVGALVIAAAGFPFGERVSRMTEALALRTRKMSAPTLIGVVVLSAAGAGIGAADRLKAYGPEFDWRMPAANGLYLQMGSNSRQAFDRITSSPSHRLWAPSNYVYGLFYGRVEVLRPNYAVPGPYQPHHLLQEINQYAPDFLVDTGLSDVNFGPATHVLHELATQLCQGLFLPMFEIEERQGYQVYTMSSDEGEMKKCKEKLLWDH